MRGSWRPNRTAIYWPHHQCCVFLVIQGCSTRSLGAHSAECWLFLQHHVSNSSDLQLNDFLSSPSYIIVPSPTQSLEWHVWSSSSGKKLSCSSQVTLFWCLSLWLYNGILPCPIVSAYAIYSHNCHRNVSLPSGASLWNGMFGRVEGQYTTRSPGPI